MGFRESRLRCKNHPDRDVYVICQKYSIGYCRECFGSDVCCCFNPKAYCDYRQQCLIWAICEQRMD